LKKGKGVRYQKAYERRLAPPEEEEKRRSMIRKKWRVRERHKNREGEWIVITAQKKKKGCYRKNRISRRRKGAKP